MNKVIFNIECSILNVEVGTQRVAQYATTTFIVFVGRRTISLNTAVLKD